MKPLREVVLIVVLMVALVGALGVYSVLNSDRADEKICDAVGIIAYRVELVLEGSKDAAKTSYEEDFITQKQLVQIQNSLDRGIKQLRKANADCEEAVSR